MATIKIKFRASSSTENEGTLFYRVTHNRIVRQISSGYKVFPQEWNAEKECLVLPVESDSIRRNYLVSLKETLLDDTKQLKSIINRLERSGEVYTADKIVYLFLHPIIGHGFIAFARQEIENLKKIGKKSKVKSYTTTLKSFSRFRNDKELLPEEVNSDIIEAYETYLESVKVCPNTISFYMRNLRAIYNRAVAKELTVQRFPFKQVYTGIDKTVKRAVSIEVIRQIRDLDLTLHPSMEYARDMFLFSFYTRGMSFVDMAFLLKKDLQNGVLTYRRHKTNQLLFIKWEKQMQEIIDKYDTSNTNYLLPIIRNKDQNDRKQYENECHRINRNLKKIGKLINLSIPLTTYVARHGWASIAQKEEIPIATISKAMGDDSEKTTRIYLDSLDTSIVDKANSTILNLL